MAPLRGAMDRHVAWLNDAHERCRLASEAVEAAQIVLQQGKMNSPTYQMFLCSTIENLRIGLEHLAMAIQDKKAPVMPVVADVRPDAVAARPIATETASVRPDALAAHPTAAETAPVRPVVAHAPERHNTNARTRKSVLRRRLCTPVVADVRLDATHPTAAETVPVKPVLADVRPDAACPTVAETAPVRPVVADMQERHNTTSCARKSVRRRRVSMPVGVDVKPDAAHPIAETIPVRPVVAHALEGHNTTACARKSVRRRRVSVPELGSA